MPHAAILRLFKGSGPLVQKGQPFQEGKRKSQGPTGILGKASAHPISPRTYRVGEAGRRWTAVMAASNRKPQQPERQWEGGHEAGIDWQCQPSRHAASRQLQPRRATVARSPTPVCPGPTPHNRVCTAVDGEQAHPHVCNDAGLPASQGPSLTHITTHVHPMRGCPNRRR